MTDNHGNHALRLKLTRRRDLAIFWCLNDRCLATRSPADPPYPFIQWFGVGRMLTPQPTKIRAVWHWWFMFAGPLFVQVCLMNRLGNQPTTAEQAEFRDELKTILSP